jgi:predicted nuclease of predicted toxin-antitoxin system
VKLLLDENLPPSLTRAADDFPASSHVLYLGFGQSSDADIYRFAGENAFAIVTRDDDFEFLSQQFGAPPKVVLLKTGNTTVAALRAFFERHGRQMAEFISAADEHRLLKIGPAGLDGDQEV